MPWRKAASSTVSPSSTSISRPTGSNRTVWVVAWDMDRDPGLRGWRCDEDRHRDVQGRTRVERVASLRVPLPCDAKGFLPAPQGTAAWKRGTPKRPRSSSSVAGVDGEALAVVGDRDVALLRRQGPEAAQRRASTWPRMSSGVHIVLLFEVQVGLRHHGLAVRPHEAEVLHGVGDVQP